MDFRILGPLEVCAGGDPVLLGGAKPRALLATLLLHANEVVSSDRLIEALWGEQRPQTATKALQVHVSQLRKALGADEHVIQTRAPGYVLELADDALDLARFRGLHERGRDTLADDPSEAARLLRQALALWRGPPLAEFTYEPFAQREIARLHELQITAVEDRVEADLALGRHAHLTGELELLIAEHPLRERLRAQLMLALYRSGRQAEALDAYQDARRVLTEELGIDPSRQLRHLQQAILAQDRRLDVPAGAQATPDPSQGVFVGRERELAQVTDALEDALAGHGRLVLLVGEPGIGKSRLADELIGRARTRGARVIVGRCWEAGGAPAYWPWVQSLREYVRETAPDILRAQLGSGAGDLAQILPELRDLFPDLSVPATADGEGARFRLFDATAQFLRRSAQSRPLLVVLDDLHAADPASLLLVRFVVRELGAARILLVCACRDVDPLPAEPLTELLAEVSREPVTRRLTLRGLHQHEVAQYVELTASKIASPELMAAVHEETHGNPFFVSEIVRLLSIEGLSHDAAAQHRLVIPQSVRDVVTRRLGHLSQPCNALLRLASVLGREFTLDALERLSGLPEEQLLETLDEAIDARVVSDVPAARGRLRFAHVLIRDTLYDEMSASRRLRLHRRAVDALEQLGGDDTGPYLAELAFHAIAGGDFDEGRRYAKRGGDRAMALRAYEEAARLYGYALEALDCAPVSDEPGRCELLLDIGEAQARAGSTAAAKQAFLDAAAIARAQGLGREVARAAAGYGGRIVWGRAGADEHIVPLLEEGLAALGDRDVELRVRLLTRLAGALRDEPRRDRRDALSAQAVALAARADEPAMLAYALAGRATAIIGLDTIDEFVALCDQLLELADRTGDGEGIVHARENRSIAHLLRGDVAASAADVGAASQIAHDLRQPALLWLVGGAQAMLTIARGKLDEAELLVEEAFGFGKHAQPEAALSLVRVQRYTLRDFRGTLDDDVLQSIRELEAIFPARPVLRCIAAHVCARLGRAAEARQTLGELSRDRCSHVPFDQEWLYAMSLLAETTALLGDGDCAAALYEVLTPWSQLNAVDQGEGIRGSVSRYLGQLAVTMRRCDDAERHFEAALSMNAAMGLRPWLAHTQTDFARMLGARDHPGDRQRGRDLRDAAIATYRRLGMRE